MKSFILRHQIVITSLVLCLISLNSASSVKKGTGADLIIKNTTAFVVEPLRQSILAVKKSVVATWSGYIYLINTKEENENLKHQLAILIGENNRLAEGLLEQNRLKELLRFTDRASFGTVTASVFGHSSINSSGGWSRTAVINKGSSDGIEINMPVIVPQGLVGRIVSTSGKTSTILLLTDPRSNIGSVLQRTRIKGIINGNGSDSLSLKYVRDLDDVQIGDTLVTTGLSAVFPKGIVVGEITKAKKGSDNFFKNILVTPTVDFDKIEEVMVVTDNLEEIKDVLKQEQGGS